MAKFKTINNNINISCFLKMGLLLVIGLLCDLNISCVVFTEICQTKEIKIYNTEINSKSLWCVFSYQIHMKVVQNRAAHETKSVTEVKLLKRATDMEQQLDMPFQACNRSTRIISLSQMENIASISFSLPPFTQCLSP